jgi:endonuclease/exonuclease/phosphatase family metal-dependent hydrolase
MSATRRLSSALAAGLAALAIWPAAVPAAPASSSGARLPMVTFNVLAPVWAAPDWYPPEMDMSLLDAAYRRARITAVLSARAADTDIFCLQEVQESELPAFLAALGGGFVGAMSHNDPDWWSNWVVPEIPWAPNGTAIIMRRQAFSNLAFRDVPLSDDGNHAELVQGVHRATGRRIRAASIHLDSDVEANRRREARALMSELPPASNTTDVVCGDFNEDSVTGTVGGVVKRAGFVDVLESVGNREPTHPWSSSYNGATRWSIIDHLTVRGAEPLSGDVLDFGALEVADELARIEANFRATGSDHFPVAGVAGL